MIFKLVSECKKEPAIPVWGKNNSKWQMTKWARNANTQETGEKKKKTMDRAAGQWVSDKIWNHRSGQRPDQGFLGPW